MKTTAQSVLKNERPQKRRGGVDSRAFNTTTTTIRLTPIQDQAVARIGNTRDGQSLFLTGEAGAGKSVVVRAGVGRLRDMAGVKFHITAYTGVAALEVNGITTSSCFDLGKNGDTTDKEWLMQHANAIRNDPKKRWSCQRIQEADLVIIDEISMVSARMLDNIDTLCRIVRGFPTKPFGGLKLVMVGDFFQLPPVTGREQEQMEHYDPDYRFAFQARVWRDAKIPTLILPGTHRQDSVEWAAILSRMRTGTLTPEDIAVLKSRVLPPPTDGRILTYMFPKNREVDAMNGQSLKALPGKTYTFAAVDWQKEGKVTWDLLKDLRAAKSIDLKVNAQVMLLRNMRRSDLALVGCILPEDGPIAGPTANLQEVILANGSVGRILRFEETMAAPAEYAVVRFERKDGRAPLDVRIEPFKFEKFENPRSPAIASRMQLPLILCYAISAHKAQGQTIECDVVIDMANAFEHGQVYVMCSRVKRLEQIHFLNFDAAKITADPAVKAFYEAQDS